MQTIIITNNEASSYIDKVNCLMDASLKQEFELLPQNINFDFDPTLIIAAPEAIYAIILIFKFGYEIINKKIKEKNINELSNITSIEIIEEQNIYKIKIENKDINIKINHKDKYIELSLQEKNE